MTLRKESMRTCVISHEKCPKKELIRIVRTPDGLVLLDKTGKLNGRGAYIKNDASVILEAKKTKALNRHLNTNVPDEIYDNLLKELEDER